ncbi:aspartate-semialdehyde dehydrogenase [Anaplasma marginale str. Dawn]|uniref:aspartate-semialdehyde dehydrogenase n=1 Tax=Anaplasma marginale TaxID=770 RepID=UPI0003C2713E|nr:aspartate-semialdehyde dehydrogenase [Anaplasma marginale]AGZ80038.1 aspartate-semialdehyde dehydrogenase [Anaplasma marginale str. Dawn]AXW84449.1 aspartate-semialdehyde dehydrogenase [Anaplasma marginale]AXW85383.1 aspartate-semialdehyde dehydrogenase [Anaplasma marginale]TZF79006.1 aspartate-semialdehyde dehydrogenase [Anaplasma marginale]
MSRIAVVGATGNVGRLVLKVLSERGFSVDSVVALSSAESAGKRLSYGENSEIRCGSLDEYDFHGSELAIFATSDAVSERYVGRAVQCDCVVIDSSSCYRMDDDVPLVIPEINRGAIASYTNKNIIASPNCSATQMLVALNPLRAVAGIKRVVASTYQSVSGAGRGAMSELYDQTKAMFVNKKLEPSEFPRQISFNCIPHVGEFLEDGSTTEEWKMSAEAQKIMGEDIKIVATCVRVPVFVCHSQALNIEFHSAISVDAAYEALSEAPGVLVLGNESSMQYVTPIDCVDDDVVYVSRIRKDTTVPYGLSMWVISDNLRKGAASNLVQIAQILVEEYL